VPVGEARPIVLAERIGEAEVDEGVEERAVMGRRANVADSRDVASPRALELPSLPNLAT
jgi:hypothetical protein